MINMAYEGDMSPVLWASGTLINSGATVTLTGADAKEIMVARLLKPMIAVIVTSTLAVTGSLRITYTQKVSHFDIAGNQTSDVTVTLNSGVKHTGINVVTSDYSTFKIVSVKNNTDRDLDSFEIYITGLINGGGY